MTKEQKNRIKGAAKEKAEEYWKKKFSAKFAFKVVLPEMIAVAIEEYHKIEEEKNSSQQFENVKELHIYLDFSYSLGLLIGTDFFATDMLIQKKRKIIHTTQTHFCSWKYANMGYRLFVHKGGHMIELKVGKNPSTDRLLKGTENLERLLLGGEFDFVKTGYEKSSRF